MSDSFGCHLYLRDEIELMEYYSFLCFDTLGSSLLFYFPRK
jgi:hypothetical protein